MIVSKEDRVLLIINDNSIYGNTRFQKYGFLLFKQYRKALKKISESIELPEFYNDWEPYNYGPFSIELARDIDACVNKNFLTAEKNDEGYVVYRLTIKGRQKYRDILDKCSDELLKINAKIKYIQQIKLAELLRQIYAAYPSYTGKSKIKDQILG